MDFAIWLILIILVVLIEIHKIISRDTLITIKSKRNDKMYIKKMKKSPVIFIHIPKNAGTFVRKTIKGENENGQDYYGGGDHMSLSQLSKQFPDVYKKHNFFAVSRNPYDRLVSNYEFAFHKSSYDMQQKQVLGIFKQNNINSFEDFVNYLYDNFQKEKENTFVQLNVIHWFPQTYFITINDKIPDKIKIINIDNITHELYQIIQTYGLNCSIHTNKANVINHKHFTSYYKNNSIKDKVYEIYKKDFQMLNFDRYI